MEKLEKWKFTYKHFDFLHAQGPSFHHWRHEKKDKIQVPQNDLVLNNSKN